MHARHKNRRGSGLIIAISVLALLAIMATSFITLMRLDTRVTRNYVDDQRCEMLAHGMMNYFKALLREDSNRTWGKYENRDTGVGFYEYDWANPGTTPPPVVRIPGLYQDEDDPAARVFHDETRGTPVSNDIWFCEPYSGRTSGGGNIYAATSVNVMSSEQQSFSQGGCVLGRFYVRDKAGGGGREYNLWIGCSQNAFTADGRTTVAMPNHPDVPWADHPDAVTLIDDDMDGVVNPPLWTWDPVGGSWERTPWYNERSSGNYYDNPPFVIFSGPTSYQPGSRMTGETLLPDGICWQWGVKVGPSHSGYANLNVHGNVDGAGAWPSGTNAYLNSMGAKLADDQRTAVLTAGNPQPPEHLGRLAWQGFPGNYNNVLYSPAAADLEKLFRLRDYEGTTPVSGGDPALARALIRYRWGDGTGIPADGGSRWRVGWRRDGASYYKFPSPEAPRDNDHYFGANEVMEHDHTTDHPGTSAIAAILGDVQWQKLRPYSTMWSVDTILRGKIWPGENWRDFNVLKRVNVNIIGATNTPEYTSGGDSTLKVKWAGKRVEEQNRLYDMLVAALTFTGTAGPQQKACQFIASLTDMIDRDDKETYFAKDGVWALGVEKHPVINEVVFYSKSQASSADYELFRIRVELYNPMENIPWIPDADEAYDISDYYLRIAGHDYPLSTLTRFATDPNVAIGPVTTIGADGMYAYPIDGWASGDMESPTWNRFAHVGWDTGTNWPPGLTKLELEGRASTVDPSFTGVKFSLWKRLEGDAATNVPLAPGNVESIGVGRYICVDRTPSLRLVQPYGGATGRNGPGGGEPIYLGIYRRWDPMNARIYGAVGTSDESNILWCPGWSIMNYPTLGRPNVDYPGNAYTQPFPGSGVSPHGYKREFERNFKVVDGDLPSIGWFGELMMMNCAQDGPFTWVHSNAQRVVYNDWHNTYEFANELDTKAKFDLYRPFKPAGKYNPKSTEMDPVNLHVLDMFTVWDPSNDGIDNDGDGAVDDEDTGRQAGDKSGPEVRVFGRMDLNLVPSATTKIAWPDGPKYRETPGYYKSTSAFTYGRTMQRSICTGTWHYYQGPSETIGDMLRADSLGPWPGAMLCGNTWYNKSNWISGSGALSEYGIVELELDGSTPRKPVDGDDDGDGIYDERDERDMIFTWVANHFTTRANVFEVDINCRICAPPYYPGKKLPYRFFRTRRQYARKQLLGILDRSTSLRVNQDGTCDFTGPVEVRMLRMSDDLRVY